MLICPVWARLAKYKTQMMICCVAMIVCFFTYPLESLFNETTPIVNSFVIYHVVGVHDNHYILPYLRVLPYYCFHVVLRFGFEYSVVIVLTSNVCYKEFRATVMGLAQTIGGVGRFLVGVNIIANR